MPEHRAPPKRWSASETPRNDGIACRTTSRHAETTLVTLVRELPFIVAPYEPPPVFPADVGGIPETLAASPTAQRVTLRCSAGRQ